MSFNRHSLVFYALATDFFGSALTEPKLETWSFDICDPVIQEDQACQGDELPHPRL